ncbi:hypothetical protein KMU_31770 [Proteus vulgaris]|nr:hypothetical protein KMU_31770 [Proteus vulgaris]
MSSFLANPIINPDLCATSTLISDLKKVLISDFVGTSTQGARLYGLMVKAQGSLADQMRDI